jgi:hypothetical protein
MKAIRVGMGSCEEVAASAFLKLFGEAPDESFKCISFEANMINRLFSLRAYEYARQRAARGDYAEFLKRRKGLSRFPVNAFHCVKCHRHFAGRNRKYALKYLEQAANLDRVFPAIDECGWPESNRCAGAQSAVSRRWRS